MSNDPFADAGESFRRQAVRNSAAHDQALSELDELAKFSENAIQQFYGASFTDVYAQRESPSQLSIRFGFRTGRLHRVLTGPWAVLFVTPDGGILWSTITRWGPPDELESELNGELLDSSDLKTALTTRLISFLCESEREYQNTIA